ncbi:MAG TPA: M12 family metallo-peptidase [Thermohalobaculum sp.]|nr:M12 family metallo-peptidase [Thermohalobaculum sp.]
MAILMPKGAAALGVAAALSLYGTAFSQQPQTFGIGAPSTVEELPAGAFRDSLLALTPQARGRAMQILRGTTTPAADFAFMRVDEEGGIFYVDPAPDEVEESGAEPPLSEPILEADVFKLHSKPGAATILYIDFDGHDLIDTRWNAYSGQPVLHMLPYDLDGNPSSFSQAEVTRIAESWRRVAEDFSDFDVDVTTEEPPFTVRASGRIQYASNVGHNLVTNQQDANGYWVYTQGGCGCGGVAYLGVFGNSYYQPGLTFNKGLGSNALTISHETGHNLNLSHDGTSTSGYYSGHGSGETSWGPIMGAPFGDSITTWSRAEYPNANNNQDDYAVISNYLPIRTDDHEDVNLGAATPLLVTGGVNVVSNARVTDPSWASLANKGIIEDPNDYDLFSMSVGVGTIQLSIDPAKLETYEGNQGANLDVQARLLDAFGTELQLSNPDLQVGADINYVVTVPGDYYLEITGVGRAGTGGSDHGHSDYVSTGQYYINGTVPPDIVTTYPPVAPNDLTATLVGDNNIELSWTDPVAAPEADEAGYRVYSSVDGLLANLPSGSEFYADNNLESGTYSYYVEVYNSVGTDSSTATAPIVIDIPFSATAVATSETTALGSTVSGSYLSTQDMPGSETLSEQHSGGKPANRMSYLDHSWTVTGVLPGAIEGLEVVASAPPNSDGENFDFTYSVNGGPWEPLGTLFAGTGEATMNAALPTATSGTVTVRVQDTDRTAGVNNTDTVTVSLIQVTSVGDPAEQPPSVSITEPADGITVTGGTELVFSGVADDFEDGNLSPSIVWSSDIDGSLGTGASAIAVLSGGTPPKTHVITAEVTDSALLTSSDTIVVTVDDTPSAQSLSVADLDGAGAPAGKGGKWSAEVTVLVVDDLGGAVAGASVNGNWSGGASGSGSCITDAAGLCSVNKGGLKGNVAMVIFGVTGISGSLPYDATSNGDPDGDSDGTSITITAP